MRLTVKRFSAELWKDDSLSRNGKARFVRSHPHTQRSFIYARHLLPRFRQLPLSLAPLRGLVTPCPMSPRERLQHGTLCAALRLSPVALHAMDLSGEEPRPIFLWRQPGKRRNPSCGDNAGFDLMRAGHRATANEIESYCRHSFSGFERTTPTPTKGGRLSNYT